MQKPMIIWRFKDGKPGHENQTTGLDAALGNTREIKVFDIPVLGLPMFPTLLLYWLVRKIPASFPTQMPDLIIGAGRKTHLPMVVAKSLCGGKTVVLMRPSLPSSLFDLIVAPEHDDVAPGQNVVEVKGVLNGVPFVDNKDTNAGLMLIGGTSSHYKWDSRGIIDQISRIVEQVPVVHWVLTTSRRTPEIFVRSLLEQIESDNITVIPFEKTDHAWMMDQFNKAGQIWVTPDSVSMVYESLSSGAVVRVFAIAPVDIKNQSRVVRGLNELIEQEYVSTFEQWSSDPTHASKPKQFNEADRIAKIVLEQLS